MSNRLSEKKALAKQDRIVFDLGMNNGDDTEYYLAKNFQVVAVEANPQLCEEASKRFLSAISSGRLIILNVAITDFIKDCVFYINTANHHWSSLDINWASRNNSNVKSCIVKGSTLKYIIERYGRPFFMKIDIEGGDIVVLHQLLEINHPPQFLSIEDCRFGFEYIELLRRIGYRGFKLSNQAMVPKMEDISIGHRFHLGASGMFGDELDGEWLPYESFLSLYVRTVRCRESLQRIAPPDVWWDIHCTL
jgi:FkbM family methyltransferase